MSVRKNRCPLRNRARQQTPARFLPNQSVDTGASAESVVVCSSMYDRNYSGPSWVAYLFA